MQISKVENLVEKLILIFLILWGAASFFVFPTLVIFEWSFLLVSLIVVYLVIAKRAEYFVLIDIIFSLTYFFYGLGSAFGLPLWVVLIGLAIVTGTVFWFLARKLIIINENFSLVLTFFLLSILELYLALSFWLINPLTKSLIIGIFTYVFTGYLANISEKNQVGRSFLGYIYTAVFVLLLLVLTVSWGR